MDIDTGVYGEKSPLFHDTPPETNNYTQTFIKDNFSKKEIRDFTLDEFCNTLVERGYKLHWILFENSDIKATAFYKTNSDQERLVMARKLLRHRLWNRRKKLGIKVNKPVSIHSPYTHPIGRRRG